MWDAECWHELSGFVLYRCESSVYTCSKLRTKALSLCDVMSRVVTTSIS